MNNSQTDEKRIPDSAGTGGDVCAEQVREWCCSKIVESDYGVLAEKLWSTRGLDDLEGDEDDWDAEYGHGGIIPAADAFILIREATNHYPFPLTEPLLDAALRDLQPHVAHYLVNGVGADGVESVVVDEIIRKLLEEPDALLG